MTTSWRRGVSLLDIATLQRGFDLPSHKRRPGKYAVVAATSVVGTHDESRVQGPGVVIGRSGTIGGAQWIDEDFWPLNTTLWVKDTKGNDLRFLYYLFGSIDFRSLNVGSGVPTLNRNHLDAIRVDLPPLAEQKKIAAVLSRLDRLIQHDERLIRDSVEFALDMASELHIRVDSVPLGDLYRVGLSGVWGEDVRTQNADTEVAVLRGRDLDDLVSGLVSKAPRRYLSRKQIASRVPQVGELWTAGSGSTLGPTLPVTQSLSRLVRQDHVSYSNFVKRLVPTGDASWYGISWAATARAWKRGEFTRYKTGTAMPNLDADAMLRSIRVPRLSQAERLRFNDVVESIFAPDLREEIGDLRTARDALVPHLLVGTISPGAVRPSEEPA